MVRLICECPNVSMTTRGGTVCASISDAQQWRRSWNRWCDRPASADLSRPTETERADLAVTEGRYGHLPRRPDGRMDLSMVSDADLAMLRATVAKLTERTTIREAAGT